MQKSTVSARPGFFLPLWARIAIACFMCAVAVLQMWEHFFRFDWVTLLCFGLYYLIHIPMQKGEAPKAYFSKTRTIVSGGLIIAAVVAARHDLHYLFEK